MLACSFKPRRLLSRLRRRHTPVHNEGDSGSFVHEPPERLGDSDLPRQTGTSEIHEESSSPGDTVDQPDLPHVDLGLDFGDVGTTDSQLFEAQNKLKESLEGLESVLQALTKKTSKESTKKFPELENRINDPNRSEPMELAELLSLVHSDSHDPVHTQSKNAATYLKQVAPLATIGLALVGNITSAVGITPVKVVTNSIAQVLDILVKSADEVDAVEEGLDDLSGANDILSDLKSIVPSELGVPVKRAALRLLTKVVDFTRLCILWLGRSIFAKSARLFVHYQTQMKDASRDLNKAKEDLVHSVSFDSAISRKQAKTEERRENKLKKLCPDKDHEVQIQEHERLSRISKVGGWAIEEEGFKRWTDVDTKIIWCPGAPGAGKTYMASRIINELEDPSAKKKIGLAWVYCKTSRAEQQTLQYVFEALARQLLARRLEICDDFVSELEKPSPTESDRKHLLASILSRFERSFLILDALDEFSLEPSKKLRMVSALKGLAQDCRDNNVRICITSRPNEGAFQELDTSDLKVEQLLVQPSEEDIKSFIYREYDEKELSWMKNNSDLRKEVANTIVKKSRCIFKLADLQVKSILRAPSTIANLRNQLGQLSSSMDDYYSEIMDRVKMFPTALKLLRWLTFVRSPMTKGELGLLLGLDPWENPEPPIHDHEVDMEDLLGQCEGLVISTLPEPNHPKYPYPRLRSEMQLAHQSIREYLKYYYSDWGNYNSSASFIIGACYSSMALRNSWSPVPNRCAPWLRTSYGRPSSRQWAEHHWGEYLDDEALTIDELKEFQQFNDLVCKECEKFKIRRSLLHVAASMGWSRACKVFSTLDGKPNALYHSETFEAPSSALVEAVLTNSNEVVRILLKYDRVDPNVGTLWHGIPLTPLMMACFLGYADIVHQLMQHKDIDINGYMVGGRDFVETEPRELKDWTLVAGMKIPTPPIMLSNSDDCLSQFLSRVDLNIGVTDLGISPLHLFACRGHKHALEGILDNTKSRIGFDINAKTSKAKMAPETCQRICEALHLNSEIFGCGRTPLHLAAYYGGLETTSYLLDHLEIDINAQDENGMNALMIAVVAGCRKETFHRGILSNLFASPKTQVQTHDNSGRSALPSALVDRLDPLLETLASPAPVRFQTPSWFKIVDGILRKPGIELNQLDHDGHAPLDYAYWAQHKSAISPLSPKLEDYYNNIISRLEEAGAQRGKEIMLNDRTIDDNLPPKFVESSPHKVIIYADSEKVQKYLDDGMMTKSN
ncbi:ankyrin [Apiospora sp. TS-2023a]